ncbi:hypothetical protein CKAN_01866900 [Cinnamomum micranthum f. kanehirae]|uniref:F-box domain-containing protein n=1 Tax=Cinnamomum micranthum f. kanehirae TaxID=337451 RepID=A0A3S4PF44_9MAGN|nr:hypothetical protein CKAN_01866900 [Cinnamomum micranthum f. kanehirae]
MKRRRLEEFALDEDVLYYIFDQFGLRDCIRMGAVCKSWLSVSKWSISTRPRPQLPWLMMLSNPNSKSMRSRKINSLLSWRMKLFNPNSKPAEKEEDNPNSKCAENEVRCFFSVYDNTIYNMKLPEILGKRCCGSFNNADARGWLMIIDDENLEVRLFHPWRRIQLQLPHHSTLQRERPFYDHSRDPLLVDLKIRKSAMSDDASMVAAIHDLWSLALWRKGNKVWTRVRSNNYRLTLCDVIHAFLSILVFAAVALFDQNVVGCFYSIPSKETLEVLTALPVGIGLISSMFFVAFQNNHQGIGFPLSSLARPFAFSPYEFVYASTFQSPVWDLWVNLFALHLFFFTLLVVAS